MIRDWLARKWQREAQPTRTLDQIRADIATIDKQLHALFILKRIEEQIYGLRVQNN